MAEVVVVGIGNDLRHDDAAGLEAARRVRTLSDVAVRELGGEALGLLDAWEGAAVALIVDALRSGAPPGTVRRFDASREPLPGGFGGAASSHSLGLREQIELGRVLGRTPELVIVYGIEGERFDAGAGMSAPVAAAVEAVAGAIARSDPGRSGTRQASAGTASASPTSSSSSGRRAGEDAIVKRE